MSTLNDKETREPEVTTAAATKRVAIVLAWAFVTLVALWFFPAVKMLLLGILAAASVAALLHPLADRLPVRRGLAALIVGLAFVVTAAGAMGTIGWLLAGPIKREAQNWPQTREQINQHLDNWSDRLNLDQPLTTDLLIRRAASYMGSGDMAASMADILLKVLIALAFIFIGSIYFLADRHDRLINPVLPMLPKPRRAQLCDAAADLGPKLRWWLLGLLVSMSLVGLVSGIGYTIAGLKFALPLACLSAVAEIVPVIGPLIAFLVALLFASTQGATQVGGAVAVWGVVQTLESYVILPLVMKRAVKMPAIVTLFTVIFWSEVFGPAGLFMAIPLNLLIWSLVDHMIIRPRKAAEARAGTSASPAT
ncbi:MAG TPA: AI-2E family transporter [Tepidisphaeraceae bacterium]|jgi:predicted PurR-regulated permease PerM|nr:AI-2E family transporter [Tepidisphaeraceae bacterium]